MRLFFIYIYAFSRHFYPKRLTVHSGYTFLSVCKVNCNVCWPKQRYDTLSFYIFAVPWICIFFLFCYLNVLLFKYSWNVNNTVFNGKLICDNLPHIMWQHAPLLDSCIKINSFKSQDFKGNYHWKFWSLFYVFEISLMLTKSAFIGSKIQYYCEVLPFYRY